MRQGDQGQRGPRGEARFGHTELPAEQEAALNKAIKFEWITLGYYAVAAFVIYLVLGNSQAMKANWVESMLAVLPPISFLVASKIIKRRPTSEHPYGYHRAVGLGHLAAGFALVIMGGYLLVESGLGLVQAEHPPIGGISLFGNTIWQGWLMMGVLMLVIPIPIYLGRVKMKLAAVLHDRVLYADADMNKADWLTNLAGVIGVAGIGFGLWWLDAVAAIVISLDILHDGVKNVHTAARSLMDARATTYDGSREDPLADQIDHFLAGLDWVETARSRIRDEGHVYHVESFVVPQDHATVSLDELDDARDRAIGMDWKIQDMVIVPVSALPEDLLPQIDTPGGAGR